MAISVEHLIREATKHETVETYIPSRYPFTYACDFMRQFPHVIPATAGPPDRPMSRAEASGIRHRWAELEGRDDTDLACVLADAYLRVHGVKKES